MNIENLKEITDKASHHCLTAARGIHQTTNYVCLVGETEYDAREAFARSVIEQVMSKFQDLSMRWLNVRMEESVGKDVFRGCGRELELAIAETLGGKAQQQDTYDCPPIAKQRQEAMAQAIQKQQPDKCPVEPPPGYVAMLGKDLPSPVPDDVLFWNHVAKTWSPSGYAGYATVSGGDKRAWYAILAAKDPQPPDWVKDPVKAMECSTQCANFANATARIKELEEKNDQLDHYAHNCDSEIQKLQDAVAMCHDKITAAEERNANQSQMLFRIAEKLGKTQQPGDSTEVILEEIEVLQAKLAATEKRVAELEWRPVSLEPRREDADKDGCVVVLTASLSLGFMRWDTVFRSNTRYWRPAALPKQPTPEEQSRAEFQAWWKQRCANPAEHRTSLEAAMLDAWQTARKEKA